MRKIDYIVIWIITIFCLVFVYFASKAHAQETFIKNGTTFTIIQESEYQRRLRTGDNVYQIIDGQEVPIKKVKACEWIPTGSLVPLQVLEDANLDGNTDWVIVRTDTNIQIAKDVKPKDTMYAGPGD